MRNENCNMKWTLQQHLKNEWPLDAHCQIMANERAASNRNAFPLLRKSTEDLRMFKSTFFSQMTRVLSKIFPTVFLTQLERKKYNSEVRKIRKLDFFDSNPELERRPWRLYGVTTCIMLICTLHNPHFQVAATYIYIYTRGKLWNLGTDVFGHGEQNATNSGIFRNNPEFSAGGFVLEKIIKNLWIWNGYAAGSAADSASDSAAGCKARETFI